MEQDWESSHSVQLKVKRLPFHNRAFPRQQAAVTGLTKHPWGKLRTF